jgi:GNAT superfamily N-acetyltransferase
MTSTEYQLVTEPAKVEDYLELRRATGLSGRSQEAAEIGLAGTWFGVHVVNRGRTVAMGRVIGDGGCFFQVVDVAVAPDHQGQGLGRGVMTALMDHVRAEAPATAQVSLLADGTAHRLYERFGFRLSAPESVGMILQL